MHYRRNLQSTLSFLVAFTLMAPFTAMAAPKPLELRWSELSPTIQGRTIVLTLPGGAILSGDVTVVRDESLVLNVRKTSDSNAYPKGNATIPRSSVTLLNLTETPGRWGRKMGSGLGTLAGVLAGGYIAAKTASSGGSALAIFGVITGAGALGGYYFGRAADARDTLIRVVP